MTTYRRLTATDLFRLNGINLDPFTENYPHKFYFNYLMQWPEYCLVAQSFDGRPMGYLMGKSEGIEQNWHGHLTVLSISPFYRRLGVARALMGYLERISDQGGMYFVDLFVRKSNKLALAMYRGFGYSIYREIIDYYSGPPENAYDMRKALSRDRRRESIVPFTRPVHASELA